MSRVSKISRTTTTGLAISKDQIICGSYIQTFCPIMVIEPAPSLDPCSSYNNDTKSKGLKQSEIGIDII